MSKAAPNKDLVESLARICHEVNAAYCQSQGDFSQPTWDRAPDWQKDSARKGVELHLNDPEASPSASHASWMAQKVKEGWKYGAFKDPEAKLHPCIVAFEDLEPAQRAKDYIFRAIVHAICAELAR